MASADRPAQNVFLIDAFNGYPEEGNPYVLYNDVTEPGNPKLVYFDGTEYIQLLRVDDAVNFFAYSAYAGIGIAVNQPITLGAGWTPIQNYDVELISTPRNISQDTAAGTLTFTQDGVYALSISITFEHNSSNQGRTTNARLWNPTDGTQVGPTFAIGVGRNVEATQFSLTAPVEITGANLADGLRLELGGGDSFSSVEINNAAYSAWSVGEYRGPI